MSRHWRTGRWGTVVVVLLLSIHIPSYAQQPTSSDSTAEGAYPQLTKFPLLSVDYFYYPNARFDTDIGQRTAYMNEFRSAVLVPIPLKKDKLYLLTGLAHTYFSFESKVESQGFQLFKEFHSVNPTIGVIKVLPKRWKFLGTFSPTLASDFRKPLGSDDLIIQASALAQKRVNRSVEYGLGIAYTTAFGRPAVIPLINYTRRKKKWITQIVLPAYAAHSYEFSKRSRVSLKMSLFGNLYNAHLGDGPNNLDLNRLSYSRIAIGPDLRTRFFKDFHLHFGGGVAVRNILEVQDDDLNTELDLQGETRFFLNIGLQLLK